MAAVYTEELEKIKDVDQLQKDLFREAYSPFFTKFAELANKQPVNQVVRAGIAILGTFMIELAENSGEDKSPHAVIGRVAEISMLLAGFVSEELTEQYGNMPNKLN